MSGGCSPRLLMGAAVLAHSLIGGAGLAAGSEPFRQDEPASAESKGDEAPLDRWFAALGAGLRSTSGAPSGTFTFDHELFGSEQGEFDAAYAGGEVSLYEVSVGLRLRGRLGLGLTWSESSLSGTADIAGRLPHPFLFDRARTVEGKAGGLSRDETAVHLSVRWLLRDSSKVQVALFGGPSRVDLECDLVSAVRFSQTYPFDTAVFAGVDRRPERGSATGYHAGVELVRYFSGRVGLGGVLRYSDTTIELKGEDGGTVSVAAGGLQAIVDLRLRF